MDEQTNRHVILIKRTNLEKMLRGQPMVLAGENFGIEYDIEIVFAETEQHFLDNVKGEYEIRRTTKEQIKEWMDNG
jgi:hypothetical protein